MKADCIRLGFPVRYSMMQESKRIITLAITGASGATYGWDLLKKLEATEQVERIFLVVSGTAQGIIRSELNISLTCADDVERNGFRKAQWLDEADYFAPIASGSHPVSAMAIAPCSMGTLGCIASGAGRNLIHRAADVMLKERKPLILVPRETPLSLIHLENMVRLSRAGATIAPAAPAFYLHPASIEDLVGSVTCRVLALLGLNVPAGSRWEGHP